MSKKQSLGTVKEVSLVSSLYQPLTLADVVDIAVFSREACKKLPDEDVIRKSCSDSEISQLIINGSRAIRFMAGETGQPEPDEAQAMLVRLVQIDAELGIVAAQSNTDRQSCIGQAQSEKKECQAGCKNSGKKFCGCFWNSFLAKANCFIDVGIDIP